MALDYGSVSRASATPATNPAIGKVYQKPDGNLYYLDSAGVEYQLTPTGGGTPYPYPTAEVPDPAPVANTGFVYSKDVLGVTQLFYEDSAGTVYQLTPVAASSPNYVFIFDGGAVPSGNVYNDFLVMMAAANALDGIKQIILHDSPPTFSNQALNFLNCELYCPYYYEELDFNGTATIIDMPIKMTNVLITYRPTVVDHILYNGHSSANGSNGLNLTMGPGSGLWVVAAPPAGDFNGAMIAAYGDKNVINMLGDSYIRSTAGTAGTDWAMFRRANPDIGVIFFAMATSQGFIAPEASVFIDDPGFQAILSGYGAFPTAAFDPFIPGIAYIRGAYGPLYPAVQDGDYITVNPSIVADGNFGWFGFFFARTVRFSLDANHIITSFDNPFQGWDVTFGIAPQVRECYNVSAFNLTFQNNATIKCTTGANIVVPPNGGARIFYDRASAVWRVSPM